MAKSPIAFKSRGGKAASGSGEATIKQLWNEEVEGEEVASSDVDDGIRCSKTVRSTSVGNTDSVAPSLRPQSRTAAAVGWVGGNATRPLSGAVARRVAPAAAHPGAADAVVVIDCGHSPAVFCPSEDLRTAKASLSSRIRSTCVARVRERRVDATQATRSSSAASDAVAELRAENFGQDGGNSAEGAAEEVTAEDPRRRDGGGVVDDARKASTPPCNSTRRLSVTETICAMSMAGGEGSVLLPPAKDDAALRSDTPRSIPPPTHRTFGPSNPGTKNPDPRSMAADGRAYTPTGFWDFWDGFVSLWRGEAPAWLALLLSAMDPFVVTVSSPAQSSVNWRRNSSRNLPVTLQDDRFFGV